MDYYTALFTNYYGVQPHAMWHEMSFRTPDPLSAFWGRD